jgi:hypothetical protein
MGVAASPAIAWPNCDTSPWYNHFAGMGRDVTDITGAQADIQWVNPSLCVQGGSPQNSWSMSWVAVVGDTPGGDLGISIYQGGFTKCANVSGSCPYNGGASYYWYFFARPRDVGCGAPYNSGVIKVKGNARSVQLNYKVAYVVIDGSPKWAFWIDHVRYNTRPASDLETCWPGGPNGIQVMNEMLDNNDQNGGTVGDHEDFDLVQYKTSTGWHGMNWTLGRACDANSYPTHWDCIVSSVNNDTFKNWDDRAP